jgi:hypothetical protein
VKTTSNALAPVASVRCERGVIVAIRIATFAPTAWTFSVEIARRFRRSGGGWSVDAGCYSGECDPELGRYLAIECVQR